MTGFGTTLAEAHTVVSYVSLTGMVYPMASIMSELPPERVQLLKDTLPTMPILPIDLFSRGTESKWDKFKHTTADDYIHNYPEVLDLKVNAQSGVYDVVGLTNWRSWSTSGSFRLQTSWVSIRMPPMWFLISGGVSSWECSKAG